MHPSDARQRACVSASPTDRASLENGARLALLIVGGSSVSPLLLSWGPTCILFGLATQRDSYGAGLSWTGVDIGTVILILAAINHVKPNVVYPVVILHGGGTILPQLWTWCWETQCGRGKQAPPDCGVARHVQVSLRTVAIANSCRNFCSFP